jgi:hypothetical protein
LIFPEKLPEGIDCQRCHGPGRAHVEAVSAHVSLQAIQAAIVNPAKLNRDRQMEVCMQCHLETSSRHMPNELRAYLALSSPTGLANRSTTTNSISTAATLGKTLTIRSRLPTRHTGCASRHASATAR